MPRFVPCRTPFRVASVPPVLVALLFAPFVRGGVAVKLADHPTSKLTAFPALHSAVATQNRVYFGYGDTGEYPPIALVSYDPATNVLAIEHSVSSDSVEMIREIDGTLYVPHCDPIHYEDFHDFSYRTPDGRWLQSAALEQLHVYDFAKSHEGLFCSANGLYRSVDEGRTWSLVGSQFGDRVHWLFEFGGTIYTGSGQYANGTFTAPVPVPEYWNHATPCRDALAGVDLMLGLTGPEPGVRKTFSTLSAFDGTQTHTVSTFAQGFCVHEGQLFVLRPDGISHCPDPASAAPTFTPLDITGLPSGGSCLARLGNRFYIGTLSGEIWTAAADGTEIQVSPPAIQHQAYDQFGRALAFSGDRLLVGAPDAPAATPLAGRAESWRRNGDRWQAEQSFTPPTADFSGWFGRDLAIHGDLLAIVEAGHDISNRDRGLSAKVHVLQRTEASWTLRQSIAFPFAQSVAIQEGLLAIGTATASGTAPGVGLYLINRSPDGVVSLTVNRRLVPRSTSIGYLPLVRVALMGDFLLAGFSGDPSRRATGVLSVFRRVNGTFASQPAQEISVDTPERYGFGLAAHSGWVAVGAPFEDTGATNAGAVYVYQQSNEPAPNPPLALRAKLSAPMPQAHAEFGAAVALHGDLLLVGCPGREVGGVRQRGAVYRFRRQSDNQWLGLGEMDPPPGSQAEFGIEVAVSQEWTAAGSLGSAPESTGLDSRVRVSPRGGYEEWLDARRVADGRRWDDDADADGRSALLEYVFNLDPKTPDQTAASAALPEPAGAPILSRSTPGDGLTLTYVEPAHDTRIKVQVESSDDQRTWLPVSATTRVLATGATHRLVAIDLEKPASPRWWRLRATDSFQ